MSPRYQALLGVVADQVVKRGQKAILWVHYPVEQELLLSIFTNLGFTAATMMADDDSNARWDLQQRFNNPGNELMVLIANYNTSGVGLNLQKACHYVHLVDPPLGWSSREQTVGRNYRLGSLHEVTVIEYFVTGSFNEKQTNQAIEKGISLFAALADLSRIGTTGDELLEVLRLGADEVTPYFLCDGELYKRDSAPAEALFDAIPESERIVYDLTAEKLIAYIFRYRGMESVQHLGFGKDFTEDRLIEVTAEVEKRASSAADIKDVQPTQSPAKPSTPRAKNQSNKAPASDTDKANPDQPSDGQGGKRTLPQTDEGVEQQPADQGKAKRRKQAPRKKVAKQKKKGSQA
ncbi:hypothetical protein K432DRAFT_97806 [Lepidopterella palustris CBS 459.81]|uniref:Helicase C-terminal domain-containing protein n=1 Tax=Lepidopterella palustris CBS 459.81 TaxID=1314670 RepID=A0A8E2DVV6_9PEZI|nr:hypothetical protein K432DRAFT_97806 [Lepidopterella palustris CBS 459.81]